jgi:hypothetical protein
MILKCHMDSLFHLGTFVLKNKKIYKITMLKDLFKKNSNIIINTDIDGFLCGMLLQKYYDCKVVGFSNSKQNIWVDPSITSIYNPIYIDLYVTNPDVVCIEQHIIGIDENHNQQLSLLGTKLNPNLERENRTFLGDYSHKYPFATVHYIIAMMENEGIHVDLPDLFNTFDYNARGHECRDMKLGYIFLRADDALHSSLNAYRNNASDWWIWLLNKSNEASSIKTFINFINQQDPNLSQNIKNQTGNFFTQCLGCDGKDGAFTRVVDNNGQLLQSVQFYISELQRLTNYKLNIPNKYITHEGSFRKEIYTRQSDNIITLINSDNMFSYAFIYSQYAHYPNFSYTIDMK